MEVEGCGVKWVEEVEWFEGCGVKWVEEVEWFEGCGVKLECHIGDKYKWI